MATRKMSGPATVPDAAAQRKAAAEARKRKLLARGTDRLAQITSSVQEDLQQDAAGSAAPAAEAGLRPNVRWSPVHSLFAASYGASRIRRAAHETVSAARRRHGIVFGR